MSEIRGKKPKLLAARIAGLRLTPEERLVMARIDGTLSVEQLASATGLGSDRLEQIVSKLALEGAVDLAEERPSPTELGVTDGTTTSFAELAAALGMDPGAFGAAPAPEPAPAATPAAPRRPLLRRYTPVALPKVAPEEAAPEPGPEPEPVPVPGPEGEPEPIAAESAGRLEAAQQAEAEAETPDERAERERAEQDEESSAPAERNYRQLFEVRWHPLLPAERAAGARTASGPDLLALCFDPDPRVIGSLLDNATAGLDHARLIAIHHRTGTGLEALARRREWLRDLLVERRLLRNPMIGEVVLARVIASKRLLPTYKIAVDREVPDMTRAKCRGHLRQKWGTSPSEERADLLLRTEARCLMLMTGCTFDAKTTAILCGRPINSVMFVQSIAKFPGSPPSLLGHLFKQPFVRKNPSLKKMLLAHPNMPGDIKRSI